MKTTITNKKSARGFECEVKRFYLPAKVETECPKCGAKVEMDYEQDYLSYPPINKTFDETFYCENEHEFEVPLRLKLTLELGK